MPYWAKTLRARGFEIAPLQAGWVRKKLQLGETELLQDLRLLLVDDRQFQGADVYRYAMRRIWWAYPLYLFSITPLCKDVFNWGYRIFATHRHEFSRACKMQNHPPTLS